MRSGPCICVLLRDAEDVAAGINYIVVTGVRNTRGARCGRQIIIHWHKSMHNKRQCRAPLRGSGIYVGPRMARAPARRAKRDTIAIGGRSLCATMRLIWICWWNGYAVWATRERASPKKPGHGGSWPAEASVARWAGREEPRSRHRAARAPTSASSASSPRTTSSPPAPCPHRHTLAGAYSRRRPSSRRVNSTGLETFPVARPHPDRKSETMSLMETLKGSLKFLLSIYSFNFIIIALLLHLRSSKFQPLFNWLKLN